MHLCAGCAICFWVLQVAKDTGGHCFPQPASYVPRVSNVTGAVPIFLSLWDITGLSQGR
jgi:hypothetical protein